MKCCLADTPGSTVTPVPLSKILFPPFLSSSLPSTIPYHLHWTISSLKIKPIFHVPLYSIP